MTTNNANNNFIVSPLTTKGDLYVFTNTNASLSVGTDDYAFFADSTASSGVSWKPNTIPPKFTSERLVDFYGNSTTAEWTISNFSSGTGAAITFNSNTTTDGTREGQLLLTTGSTNAGNPGFAYPISTNLYANNGELTAELDINITQLSNNTDAFTVWFGLSSSIAGAIPTSASNALFFTYTHTVNSGKWVINAANTSLLTSTNTTSTINAGAWARLTIVRSANGSSVDFYVNGVNVGTISSNLPAATVGMSSMISIVKSAGNTACTATIDYIYVKKTFSTAR